MSKVSIEHETVQPQNYFRDIKIFQFFHWKGVLFIKTSENQAAIVSSGVVNGFHAKDLVSDVSINITYKLI